MFQSLKSGKRKPTQFQDLSSLQIDWNSVNQTVTVTLLYLEPYLWILKKSKMRYRHQVCFPEK